MRRIPLALLLVLQVNIAFAGPPYVTDDPEPVPLHHWEFYVASQTSHDGGDWSGTAPHIEVNYGAAPELQLHAIFPVAFSAPAGDGSQFGYGDTELGAKYRFVEEGDRIPQIGIFPLLEVPTGSASRDLGSGQVQAFVPIWMQKSRGPWTTYGGGGYWVNPGAGNRNYWLFGWLVQREIIEPLSLGVEVFHETPKEEDGPDETDFNAGFVLDISDLQHLLFSAGRSLHGPNRFQSYLAYQLTWGP